MPEDDQPPPSEDDAPELPPWRYSEAKKQLIKDILDGTLDGKGPGEVHEFRPEYKERKYENFRTNLNNLRKALKEQRARADSDDAALAHDEALNLRTNSKPYPRWQGTEAERLLKLAIDNGQHIIMQPQELKNTCAEYEPYPLKVFRDHIQQELRSRTERPYWLARRAEKEAEKAKAKAKKAAKKGKPKEKKKKRPPPEPVA